MRFAFTCAVSRYALTNSGAGNNFFGRASPLFCSKSTISRFGERFRDGQYSLVSFSFAVLLLTVHPCHTESAPLLTKPELTHS